jgi:DNA-directed RNA polymerase subunit F
MKYIKLFENIDHDIIDKDYIEMCFVDFIDEDNFIIKFHPEINNSGKSIMGDKTCEITIDMVDSSSINLSNSINEFIKRVEMRSNLFNRIQESLSKIKIEYPTIKHKIMDMTGADEEEVKIILSVSESYISYNPSGWFPL